MGSVADASIPATVYTSQPGTLHADFETVVLRPSNAVSIERSISMNKVRVCGVVQADAGNILGATIIPAPIEANRYAVVVPSDPVAVVVPAVVEGNISES